MVRPEFASAMAAVVPAGIMVPVVPPVVILPLPVMWIAMVSVAGKHHLLVMIFPVDTPIRFLLHLIQTGPFPVV
jgi:hypothetical protein